MNDLILEDYRIATDDPAVSLYMRNKRRADVRLGVPDRTLLFVHGATYASTVTFDMPLAGRSWMDELAGAGFDVWLLDLRGYGASDRPAEMAAPPEANGPIVHTAVAVADLGRAVDHVLRVRGIDSLQLLGYSWGTIITGAYTAANGDRVERLALYATNMLAKGASLIGTERPTTSYRLVSADDARKRWLHGLEANEVEDIVDPEWMAAWLEAAIASDPQSAEHDPPRLRAPTGVVDDKVSRWSKGTFEYDPARIGVPTLVVVGDRDVETPPEGALNLYRHLTGTRYRQFTLLGHATHSALLERRRDQLFRVVRSFLEATFD